MSDLRLTCLEDDCDLLTIIEPDYDGEAVIEVLHIDKPQSVYINKDMALQIVKHLIKMYDLNTTESE